MKCGQNNNAQFHFHSAALMSHGGLGAKLDRRFGDTCLGTKVGRSPYAMGIFLERDVPANLENSRNEFGT
ncbi:hypothetical protein JTE90_002206 [Oedothorax gibbosus]|uniref:Uncharacterized protein n=1 Tax=Oedothorax gibbosus TaxID=931172 RepID=A0AAV6VIU9_9ARAC|nr:hypothetical protein JTE90_002206 [Oedothorax gibbosus]